MTAIADEPAVALHPGWGIAAELMPPEILDGRRAKVIQRLMVLGLAGLLAICALSYGAVRLAGHGPAADLKKVNAQTVQLQQQQRSYNNVVRIKGQISAANSQLAALMASDTDIAQAVTATLGAAPIGTTIDQLSVAINAAGGQATAATGAGAANLDTGTAAHIGTISISGVTPQLTDVAAYVDSLAAVPGIAVPYPGTSSVGPKGTNFSIQVVVTSVLHSSRFDGTKNGK
jgi:hypothetical protein